MESMEYGQNMGPLQFELIQFKLFRHYFHTSLVTKRDGTGLKHFIEILCPKMAIMTSESFSTVKSRGNILALLVQLTTGAQEVHKSHETNLRCEPGKPNQEDQGSTTKPSWLVDLCSLNRKFKVVFGQKSRIQKHREPIINKLMFVFP